MLAISMDRLEDIFLGYVFIFLTYLFNNLLNHQFCLGFSEILLDVPVPSHSLVALLTRKQKREGSVGVTWKPNG